MNRKIVRFTTLIAALTLGCSDLAPTPAPTASHGQPMRSASPTSSASPEPAAVMRFEAPGITFDYPSDWIDQTSVAGELHALGQRRVAALALGMSLCPGDEAPPAPSSGPGGCLGQPVRLGQLRFDISENLAQYPGRWDIADTGGLKDGLASQHWIFEGRDGGMYRAMLRIKADESVDRWVEVQEQVRALLRSVRTEPWEPPPPSTDGLVRQSTPYGFAFQYPLGWARYFPRPPWGDERAVVTVSSRQLEPPVSCTSSFCPPFRLPPDTVVIALRLSNPNTASYWRAARYVIGGRPAIRLRGHPWRAILEDQAIWWRIRIPNHTLEVLVRLRGPDLKAGRAAARAVLDSMEIGTSLSEIR
jgi:hypothetical protein